MDREVATRTAYLCVCERRGATNIPLSVSFDLSAYVGVVVVVVVAGFCMEMVAGEEGMRESERGDPTNNRKNAAPRPFRGGNGRVPLHDIGKDGGWIRGEKDFETRRKEGAMYMVSGGQRPSERESGKKRR